MTKNSNGADSAPQSFGVSGFDPTAILQSFMTKVSEASIANPASGWLEMNQRWMSFLTERFEQDAALVQRLSKCTNPAEIRAAHAEFHKKAVEDYQQEFAEMAELSQKAMGQLTNNQDKGDTDQNPTIRG